MSGGFFMDPPDKHRLHLSVTNGRVVHFSIPENGTVLIPIDINTFSKNYFVCSYIPGIF